MSRTGALFLLLPCLILAEDLGATRRISNRLTPHTIQSADSQSTQQSPSAATPESDSLSLKGDEVEQSLWRNARTYLDLPTSELVTQIKELHGLVPEDNPNQLSLLLDRIGKSCVDLLQHTPNLASREKQKTTEWIFAPLDPTKLQPELVHPKYEEQEFEYLLLAHQTERGKTLQEYRTDKHGQPIQDPASRGGQMTQGFVTEWLQMLPANQSQARFRYLGRQELLHRNVFVIAFAQIPGKVRAPATFVLDGRPVHLLFQGILWVDETDSRIVRMIESLLAPRNDVGLSNLTTKISFDAVFIPKAEIRLWLPKEVTIHWHYRAHEVEQRHDYSNYHLYAVNSKIVLQ